MSTTAEDGDPMTAKRTGLDTGALSDTNFTPAVERQSVERSVRRRAVLSGIIASLLIAPVLLIIWLLVGAYLDISNGGNLDWAPAGPAPALPWWVNPAIRLIGLFVILIDVCIGIGVYRRIIKQNQATGSRPLHRPAGPRH
jgi:hypothetical protein